MTVTDIVELAKSRYKVYIDSEFAFVLYRGELRGYCIKPGEELTEKAYSEILNQVLPKRAKLRAMNLLKNRTYTEQQLRSKLQQGFYPQEVIEEAVGYVKSYHYVDDERYAQDYIAYQSPLKSRKRIETDLLRKGIQKELIQKGFEQLGAYEQESYELQQIEALLTKKKYYADTATREETMKMYGFLYRRGFSAESIRKGMQNAENCD